MSNKTQALHHFIKKFGHTDQRIILNIFKKYTKIPKKKIDLNIKDYQTILNYLNKSLQPHYSHTEIIDFECVCSDYCEFDDEISINLNSNIKLTKEYYSKTYQNSFYIINTKFKNSHLSNMDSQHDLTFAGIRYELELFLPLFKQVFKNITTPKWVGQHMYEIKTNVSNLNYFQFQEKLDELVNLVNRLKKSN